MKVSGHRIKAAIKTWELKREVAAKQFAGSLWKFKEEEKNPLAITEEFAKAEFAIAKLQEAQALYNLSVKLKIGEVEMSLCEAVKRVGGAARLEKMWRLAATSSEETPYSYRQEVTKVRNANEVHAEKTVTEEKAVEMATSCTSLTNTFRGAIAEGNGVQLELDVDSNLFI